MLWLSIYLSSLQYADISQGAGEPQVPAETMHKRGRDLVSFFGLPKARKVEADKSNEGQECGETARAALKKVCMGAISFG